MTLDWRAYAMIAFISLTLSMGGYIRHVIAENARLEASNSQWKGNYENLTDEWNKERKKLKDRDIARRQAEENHGEEVGEMQRRINELLETGDKCVGAPVPPSLRDYTGSDPELPATP